MSFKTTSLFGHLKALNKLIGHSKSSLKIAKDSTRMTRKIRGFTPSKDELIKGMKVHSFARGKSVDKAEIVSSQFGFAIKGGGKGLRQLKKNRKLVAKKIMDSVPQKRVNPVNTRINEKEIEKMITGKVRFIRKNGRIIPIRIKNRK